MSSSEDIIKPIKDIFKINYNIPEYQRGYKQGKEQVLELLEDIYEFNTNKNNEDNKDKFYCLQNITITIKENNIFEEVEKRCQSFIDSDPLINAYRKKEWNEYFYKEELSEAIKEREFSMAKSMKKKIQTQN